MVTLVVQSFHATYELRRAVFAILSFYAHASRPVEETQLMVFTDQPEFFKDFLSGLPVHYVPLTADRVREMRGQIDFLHRMKIAAIEQAFNRFPDNSLLYFDSDSFFIADPHPFIQRLSPNLSYMHKHEYKFEEMAGFPLPAGATFHAYLKLIKSKNFQLASGETISVNPRWSSWNAGVIMLYRSHAAYIPDVYALTDQTYPVTGNHASEQYAFSIVLQTRTQLEPCENVNYHYWYRVKKQIADLFLSRVITDNWAKTPLTAKLTEVRAYTRLLSGRFDDHVLSLRDNAIQAFNENKFGDGYSWAAKAIRKAPFGDLKFYKDVLYHFKRHIKGR
jgi:hypothetical protein